MNPTVLIVDDEPSVMALVADYLMGTGFTVLPTTDGHEAVQALRAVPVDVVVSDIRMPRPDGWDLLEEVRRTGQPTQTIIITGCGTDVLHREAAARGACAVLEKPFTRQRFVTTVREAVKRARPAPSWYHSQSC